MNEIVIYEDGTVELPVSFNKENFWLSQADLVNLYEKDQSVVSRHINKIFKDEEIDKKSNMQKMHIGNISKTEELDKDSTCSILEQVAKDGKKQKMNFYNNKITMLWYGNDNEVFKGKRRSLGVLRR